MKPFRLIPRMCLCFALVAPCSLVFESVQAVTVPFTEEFVDNHSDWRDAGSFSLSFNPAGGPDGSSYVSTSFAFNSGGGAGGSSAVLVRGHDEFGTNGSSGGNFAGNWIAAKARRLTAFVRHDAPEPLTYFLRVSSPFNFPGATAIRLPPVFPNVWTEIEFDTGISSSQFVTFEGSDYSTVFSNIGHVQLGVSIPTSLETDKTVYAFDFDRVSIGIPEPSTLMLACPLLVASCVIRRRSIRR